MLRLRCPDDRRSHSRLMQEPRQGHLGVWNPAFPGYLSHAVHDREIRLGEIHRTGEIVGLGAARIAAVSGPSIARQETPCQRTPGQEAETLISTEWIDLAFLLAIDQVVVILHRDKAGQAQAIRSIEHLGKLPGK